VCGSDPIVIVVQFSSGAADMKLFLLIPLVFLITNSANAQPPGPPVSDPVDANVLNFYNVWLHAVDIQYMATLIKVMASTVG
jgi:hypothetical protein